MARQETDQLDPHPSDPRYLDPSILREPPTDDFARPSSRVRRRPHPRYETPHEMWEWHWVRMRIVLTWTVILVCCLIALTGGVVIFSELT